MDNKKSLIALALVAVVGIVGGTFAYFTSSTTLNNEFVTGTYATSVKEEFVSPSNWTPGTTTTKKVNVTNNGSVDVAVRASYTEKWTAASGRTLPLVRGVETIERIAQFTIGNNWIKATDGYYYYNDTLIKGETSTDFISSVTFNPNFELMDYMDIECKTSTVNGTTTVNCANLTSGYAGATYSLEITIETIQADKAWTYTQPPLITFSIKGTSYQALEGMTWAEFVVSEYNTSDEFLVDNLNFNYTAGYGLIDSQGYGQSLSTTIKANEAYDTEYIGYRV